MSDHANKTFIVQVKQTENNTWQGTVEWLDQKGNQSFRSALELIRLIDSAVKKEQA